MKLQMHSVHFTADQKLLDFIQKRADKLETFFDRIVDGEVFLKVTPDTDRENKLVEMKINIPGQTLFAESKSNSFEAATDEVTDALRRQLKKHKEKMTSR